MEMAAETSDFAVSVAVGTIALACSTPFEAGFPFT
jgi:hypothetical protein